MKMMYNYISSSVLSNRLNYSAGATVGAKGIILNLFSVLHHASIEERSRIIPFSFPRQTPMLKKFIGLSVSILHVLQVSGLRNYGENCGVRNHHLQNSPNRGVLRWLLPTVSILQ